MRALDSSVISLKRAIPGLDLTYLKLSIQVKKSECFFQLF